MRARTWMAVGLTGCCFGTLASSSSPPPSGQIHLRHAGSPIPSTHPLCPTSKLVKFKDAATVAIQATDANLLTAVQLRDGDIAWRLASNQDEKVLNFVLDQDSKSVLVTSGHGGSHVRLLSSRTGRIEWDVLQHPPIQGFVPDASFHASDAAFLPGGGDVVSLANGRTVRRIDGKTGQVAWKHDFETSNVMRARLVPVTASSSTHLVVVALDPKPNGQLALHLDFLDLATGSPRSSTPLAASHPLASIASLLVLITPAGPVLAWTSPSGVIVTALVPSSDPSSSSSLSIKQSSVKTVARIEDVGLSRSGYFLARKQDGSALALLVSGTGEVEVKWTFPESDHEAVYTSAVDKHGSLHIARVSYSAILGLSSYSVATMPCPDYPDGIITGETFPFDRDLHGRITSAVIEVTERKDFVAQSRILVSSTLGTTAVWTGHRHQWSRVEDLSSVKAIARSSSRDSPAVNTPAASVPTVADLVSAGKDLVKAFGSGKLDLASAWSGLGLKSDKALARPGPPLPPAWYVGTGKGRVHALSGPETGGRVMWTVNVLAPPDDDEQEDEEEEGQAGWEVGWVRLFEGQQDGKVVGEVVVKDPKQGGKERTVVVVVEAGSGKVLSRVRGESSVAPARDRQALPLGTTLIPHDRDVGASPARVSGDRSITPKYLDPSLVLSISCLPSSTVARVSVVDGTRGDVVDAFDVENGCDGGSGGGRGTKVRASVTGNMVVVVAPMPPSAQFDATTPPKGDPNGARSGMSVVNSRELYLRNQTDTKLPASAPGKAKVVEKTFLLPFGVKSIVHARTRLGVSSRALIAITDDDRVVMIPRRLLDPHRPSGKPDKVEVEEGLLPLTSPIIELGLDAYLTGPSQPLSLEDLASFATPYESTSTVVASGRADLFILDVHPSGRAFDMLGDSFNRPGLVLTVLGLFLAVMVARPVVASRKLNAEWYS